MLPQNIIFEDAPLKKSVEQKYIGAKKVDSKVLFIN